MQTWHDVSRHTPCPICGKPDWCRVSTDGTWAICRRANTGSGLHKRDKGGAEYWLYRLDGGSLQQRPAGMPEALYGTVFVDIPAEIPLGRPA